MNPKQLIFVSLGNLCCLNSISINAPYSRITSRPPSSVHQALAGRGTAVFITLARLTLWQSRPAYSLVPSLRPQHSDTGKSNSQARLFELESDASTPMVVELLTQRCMLHIQETTVRHSRIPTEDFDVSLLVQPMPDTGKRHARRVVDISADFESGVAPSFRG